MIGQLLLFMNAYCIDPFLAASLQLPFFVVLFLYPLIWIYSLIWFSWLCVKICLLRSVIENLNNKWNQVYFLAIVVFKCGRYIHAMLGGMVGCFLPHNVLHCIAELPLRFFVSNSVKFLFYLLFTQYSCLFYWRLFILHLNGSGFLVSIVGRQLLLFTNTAYIALIRIKFLFFYILLQYWFFMSLYEYTAVVPNHLWLKRHL